MRSVLASCLACLLASPCLPHAGWSQKALHPIEAGQLKTAAQRALDENKYLLIAFTGDGWSLESKWFAEKVLDTPEFREFSQSNLVYLPVKARRSPKLTAEETAVLQSWVIHFDIKSYPTIILLAPDGTEILRHGYREVDAREYVELLQAVLPLD